MPRRRWLVLFSLIAGVPPGAASAAEAQLHDRPNQLQAVDYATLPGGGALVRVVLAEALRAPPGMMVIHYPVHRIALDFPGTVSAAGRQPIEVGQRGLRRIQVVQSGTRSRLILELDRPVRFETALEGKALLITLRRPDTSAARDATGRFQDPVAGVPGFGIRDVEFQPGESGEGRIVVEVSDAAVPIEVRRQGARLVVDFLNAQVPRQLARRLDVQDFGTPVRTIDTYPLGGHARISVELAAAGELSVYQFDRRLVLAPLH